MQDFRLLSIGLALEVVGLHAMRCQHRDLCLLVLGHEVMVQSVIDLLSLSRYVRLFHGVLTHFLLDSKGQNDALGVDFVDQTLRMVLFLLSLQQAVVTEQHFVDGFVVRLFRGFLCSLLSDLLFAPVLLLHLLHALPVAEA